MQCVELMEIKVRLAKKTKVKGRILWPLNNRPGLEAAIKNCLETGKEEYFAPGAGVLFHVRPEFPLIDSAMSQPENRKFLKVYVRVYTQALTLGVEA